MKRCKKCITVETVDTIEFDEAGICSVCRQIEYKKENIDWEARRKQLDVLVDEHRNKGLYDCIVPFSGGKDSTFQLWYVVNELKLKPLVVRFNHWGYRPLVHENNTKVFKQLGVDVVDFTPNFQWKFDRYSVPNGPELPDMDQWDKTRVDEPVGPEKDAEGRTNKYV